MNKDTILKIGVAWIILSSGTVFYTLYNMSASMIILLLLAVICASDRTLKANFSVKNRQYIAMYFIILVLNSAINLSHGFILKDFIIIAIKIIAIGFIASTIDSKKYRLWYADIMTILAVISLVCWIYVMVNKTIPFETTIYAGKQYYVGNFLYTYQFESDGSLRNKGLFWEPGYYQVFLNLAIIFYLSLYKNILNKVERKRILRNILILAITVLSTQSSTAFVCLAIVLCYMILFLGTSRTDGGFFQKYGLKILGCIVVIALVIAENNLGMIETKVINGEGSFTTRMNDTVACFKAASENSLTGIGWFANDFRELTMQYGAEYNNSSQLGAIFVRFGYFLGSAYLLALAAGVKRMCKMNYFQILLIMILIIIFFATESVNTTPVFLAFLLYFNEEEETPYDYN